MGITHFQNRIQSSAFGIMCEIVLFIWETVKKDRFLSSGRERKQYSSKTTDPFARFTVHREPESENACPEREAEESLIYAYNADNC